MPASYEQRENAETVGLSPRFLVGDASNRRDAFSGVPDILRNSGGPSRLDNRVSALGPFVFYNLE
jgi:hypothetical protein